MRVSAILLAAGRGVRFGVRVSKPLVKVNSLPIITYSLRLFNSCPQICEIIVVVNKDNRQGIIKVIKQQRIAKALKIVLGGERRQDSVSCGLKAMDSSEELVLVHDSARPFIDRKIVLAAIKEAGCHGAAIAAVPVKDTIKEVASNRIVKRTLDRKRLWEVQTPQVFQKELLLKAYQRFGRIDATDDAMLVEKLGKPVRVVLGSYNNIKITTPEDLAIAQVIAKNYAK